MGADENWGYWSTYQKSLECLQQPVSYKRYFRCNNCFLLLVYTINLSLSTDLVDPPPIRTFYKKHALCNQSLKFLMFYAFKIIVDVIMRLNGKWILTWCWRMSGSSGFGRSGAVFSSGRPPLQEEYTYSCTPLQVTVYTPSLVGGVHILMYSFTGNRVHSLPRRRSTHTHVLLYR